MKFKYRGIFLLFLLTILFLLPFYMASALEVEEYPNFLGLSITKSSSLIDYARYLFNAGMAIAGFLAVLVIMFGGVYYLISLSRGKFTDEGKQWIKAGVLGLILLVSAYLIAYTINPALIDFRLQKLFPVGLFGSPGGSNPSGPPRMVYEEIPLGTLTENLLSRTMDCYNYDGNGDPVEGDPIETDNYGKIIGPTYLEHDRADCFLKLTEATEKKAKLIKKLSDEIVKLMETCVCDGKCDETCDKENGCAVSGKSCVGSCKLGACKPFQGKDNDCCPKNSGIKDPKTGKELTVKEVIEHGPIKITDCNGLEKEYKGLDEFRSQYNNSYDQIKNKVEIQPPAKINGKPITIIKNGNCQTCNYQCLTCDPKDKKYSNCLKDQQKCQQDKTNCLKNRQKCLSQNSPWYSLRLIDQPTYLEGKMNEIKLSVENDLNQLNSARTKIANCYTIKSSVDFLEIFEKTKKEDKIILKNRSFKDVTTGKVIDSSKYCRGFEYANSNCYSRCQNICPETMAQAENLKCYKGCDNKCDEKKGAEKETCLNGQKICVKKCYDERKCPQNLSNFKTFPECMNACSQQCSDACDKNYSCSQDLQKCKKSCNNDSKCLLENEEKCTVNFLQLKECTKIYQDPDNLKNCMNNSFLCKYGSDQFAGYPDCVKNQGQYSSSYLFQNPSEQKCRYPYQLYTSGVNAGQNCLSLYPETAKCPASSMCPQCPCGIVNETINYNSGETVSGGGSSSSGTSSSGSGGPCNGQPMQTCSNGTVSCYCPTGGGSSISSGCSCPGGTPGTPSCYPPCSGSSSGGTSSSSSGGSSSSTKILEYQVATVNCNEFTYIGDPLTFYCRASWEPEAPISGKWLDYSKADEIPVGQTVDNSIKWANEFIKNITNFIKITEEMIQYIKKIGQEQNYCKCDSICENGRPCSSDCIYHPSVCTDVTNSDGSITKSCTDPSCSVKPCAGISCQKMINLLKGGSTKSCPVKKDGVFYYYNKIYTESKTFYKFTLLDKRSDIVKELSYSRKKMDQCSQQAVKLGADAIMTFNCTIAYRGISALPKRCYGIYDGQVKTPPEDKTDNWFCLKTLLK